MRRYLESLSERLKEYGLTPDNVQPIGLSPNSKIPRKILPEHPIVEAPTSEGEPQEKRLKYDFGGEDPRFDNLSALELFSLGRYGTKESDPEL